MISIHALREEGDTWTRYRQRSQSISIHALREEGDTGSLRTGSDRHRISIHALREEGDLHLEQVLDIEIKFLSTPSARRATLYWDCIADK